MDGDSEEGEKWVDVYYLREREEVRVIFLVCFEFLGGGKVVVFVEMGVLWVGWCS